MNGAVNKFLGSKVTHVNLPAPLNGQRIDLVEEDDSRGSHSGLAEHFPDGSLGLSDPLVEELRTLRMIRPINVRGDWCVLTA